jgi:hypothetical protein
MSQDEVDIMSAPPVIPEGINLDALKEFGTMLAEVITRSGRDPTKDFSKFVNYHSHKALLRSLPF